MCWKTRRHPFHVSARAITNERRSADDYVTMRSSAAMRASGKGDGGSCQRESTPTWILNANGAFWLATASLRICADASRSSTQSVFAQAAWPAVTSTMSSLPKWRSIRTFTTSPPRTTEMRRWPSCRGYPLRKRVAARRRNARIDGVICATNTWSGGRLSTKTEEPRWEPSGRSGDISTLWASSPTSSSTAWMRTSASGEFSLPTGWQSRGCFSRRTWQCVWLRLTWRKPQ